MKMQRFAVSCGIALGAISGSAGAFNTQPDPPGFGIVSINPDQTIRLNLVCWAHEVEGLAAAPCSGELMFHDAAGNVVAIQAVKLAPGGTTYVDYALGPRTSPINLVGINPCWMPGSTSGRALPTVEVFDTASGRVARHVNPLTPRITAVEGRPR
jgi:hypothetical protein